MGAVRLAIAAAALLLAAAAQDAPAQATDKPCSKADAQKAEKAVDLVVTWPQLHKAWKDFGHCDTGEVNELYTDALLRLMVPWRDVEILATSMQNDPKFRDFVYAHLKSPAAKDDRQTVYSRAKAACPKGLDEFCAGICEVVKQ